MNTQRQYPTNLIETQWQLLLTLLPKPKWRFGCPGRPPVNLRQVFNGILYLTKTGCQWRMLPRAFGCWQESQWPQASSPCRYPRPANLCVCICC